MASPKTWTVMVWMAGDNDLEDFAKADLKELKQVGSTGEVDVVVQLDSMHDDRTRRYHVRSGTTIEADEVATLPETNTGDPAVAIDFFTWAIKTFPARHYVTTIWNHGSGIDETDVYRTARARGMTVERRASPAPGVVPRSRVRALVARRHRRALFATTVQAALSDRAIAYDDTSKDFLDNLELRKVLAAVRRGTKRKIDLLGFDACLMNMLEIAYELRADADYIAASEQTEPGDGWPYDTILRDLVSHPDMTPRELGTRVVKSYVASYAREAVTMSLVDEGQVDAAARAVDALAGALVTAMKSPAEYAAVAKAVNAAQAYEFTEFLDLVDFSQALAARTKSRAVKEAAKRVASAVTGLVAAESHRGAAVARSHGVAIYVPRGREVTVAYDRLAFARSTRWDTFIAALKGS